MDDDSSSPTIGFSLSAVASKVERADEFEAQLLGGDTHDVLKTVKETDSKAFDKIVDNYLQVLHSVDKDAYFDVCGNLIKSTIARAAQKAKASNDDELLKDVYKDEEYPFIVD